MTLMAINNYLRVLFFCTPNTLYDEEKNSL
ncbi:hypothetical protein DFQ12_3137 [Sphingobacterium detergens]|uniref:Uncharacterized protein n=1 Tax=Sphingobacterium detergens TaxID=1145106 RepID=A0A420B857_SPHD1|nr:hypothetical protein DFQ12_3137 [Sphingobacterium detergens]